MHSLVRPPSQETDRWCKRVDRALDKVKSNNMLVATRFTPAGAVITLIRYDMSNARRVTQQAGTYSKSRIVPSSSGWSIPIDYGQLGMANNVGVSWFMTVKLGCSSIPKCTFIRDAFPCVDTGVPMEQGVVVSDTMTSKLVQSVSRYAPDILESAEIKLAYVETPDILPALLTTPSIDCARAAQVLIDHVGLEIPIEHL